MLLFHSFQKKKAPGIAKKFQNRHKGSGPVNEIRDRDERAAIAGADIHRAQRVIIPAMPGYNRQNRFRRGLQAFSMKPACLCDYEE
jgi:hypothetical protein